MMKDNLTVGLCYPVVTNITKFNDEYNMVMDLFAPRQPDKELNYCYSWYQFSMSLCQYENWILLTGLALFFLSLFNVRIECVVCEMMGSIAVR